MVGPVVNTSLPLSVFRPAIIHVYALLLLVLVLMRVDSWRARTALLHWRRPMQSSAEWTLSVRYAAGPPQA